METFRQSLWKAYEDFRSREEHPDFYHRCLIKSSLARHHQKIHQHPKSDKEISNFEEIIGRAAAATVEPNEDTQQFVDGWTDLWEAAKRNDDFPSKPEPNILPTADRIQQIVRFMADYKSEAKEINRNRRKKIILMTGLTATSVGSSIFSRRACRGIPLACLIGTLLVANGYRKNELQANKCRRLTQRYEGESKAYFLARIPRSERLKQRDAVRSMPP